MELRVLITGIVLCLTGCDDMGRWAYQAGLDAEKSRAGLVERNLATPDGLEWYLLESESARGKPVVMLIHGFGADSSNWVRFVNEMEGRYHFIVPDLPGHGESTRSLTLDYGVHAQAQRLLELADILDIKQFHVAGSSMGGAIGIAMALEAPERVLSLGLVNAAGVTLRSEAFTDLIGAGSNPLIPRKPEDMYVTLEWAMADPPWLPDFFVMQMGALKAANAAVADKVHTDVDGKMELRSRLSDIQVPTLVVWGDRDRLLSLENAAVFDDEIPNSRAVILNGIGHLPMAEAPDKTADALGGFWQEAETYIARIRLGEGVEAVPAAVR